MKPKWIVFLFFVLLLTRTAVTLRMTKKQQFAGALGQIMGIQSLIYAWNKYT